MQKYQSEKYWLHRHLKEVISDKGINSFKVLTPPDVTQQAGNSPHIVSLVF